MAPVTTFEMLSGGFFIALITHSEFQPLCDNGPG
jgi:hypothetical protein